MPFRNEGRGIVNVVIVLILVGIAGPKLFPDLAWLRWVAYAGYAGAGVFLLTVLADSLRGSAEERRKRTLLNRLVSMAEDGSGDAAESEAIRAELAEGFVQLPDLVATKGFAEAAQKGGPHRLTCLRLVLRHGWMYGEPWITVLTEGRDTLKAADLTPEEQERVATIDTWLEKRKEQEAE